ncbi:MAG: methyltransferase domain-containing protein [Micropepsaceae bacterium]
MRTRAVVQLVCDHVFRRRLVLQDAPIDKGIVGVGLSDWAGYSKLLETKLGYTNTFFHKAPYLDISSPKSFHGACDFVVSSDVFEHVKSPVARAFEGAFSILKPGGKLILTVPFTNADKTVEHFEEFDDFEVVMHEGKWVVVGRKVDGHFGIRSGLIFHGGDGETLELRVFCRSGLLAHLKSSGFVDVRVVSESDLNFGIVFKDQWSLPIIASKPI